MGHGQADCSIRPIGLLRNKKLLANVFSLSHVTAPEVFAIVNLSQFPFGF